jgi:hypothetical protein
VHGQAKLTNRVQTNALSVIIRTVPSLYRTIPSLYLKEQMIVSDVWMMDMQWPVDVFVVQEHDCVPDPSKPENDHTVDELCCAERTGVACLVYLVQDIGKRIIFDIPGFEMNTQGCRGRVNLAIAANHPVVVTYVSHWIVARGC